VPRAGGAPEEAAVYEKVVVREGAAMWGTCGCNQSLIALQGSTANIAIAFARASERNLSGRGTVRWPRILQ